MKKIALVTGTNRGIGFEVAKELAEQGMKVIATSRDIAKGEKAVKELQENGLDITYCQLDVTDENSIQQAFDFVNKEFQCLDVLINNAGVCLDCFIKNKKGFEGPLATDMDILMQTLTTNTIGPYRICQVFIPLMMQNHYGRVVNVSSIFGQLTTMSSGEPACCVSKAALNAVTCVFSNQLRGTNILVNSVCPGWVHTDMGGSTAPRSLEKGAETIIWAAHFLITDHQDNFFKINTL